MGENNTIIANHEVLLPEFLPASLIFRSAEYKQVLACVKNRINTLIVGPVGSGKTSLVKMLQNEIGVENLAYVDCLVHDTGYAVLKAVVPSVRAAFLRSTFELLEELKRTSNSRKVICFDNFTRLREISVLDKIVALGITTVLVASVDRDLALLNTNSRLNTSRVLRLRNYTTQEVYTILRGRAEQGLKDGSFDDSILKCIVNRVKGNVTVGITVLRTAALKAEAEGKNRIVPEDISDVLPKSRDDLDLIEDERVIMRILRERNVAVEHKQLYNLYCQSATSPKQERTFKSYLQRLIAKSFVRVSPSDNTKLYEVIDYP